MHARLVEAWETLKWEEHRAPYRADVWAQPNAPPGTEQEFIGWRLYSYELTDVDDVTRALEWLETRTRDVGQSEDVHKAVCTLYAVVRTASEGDGLVLLYGIDPTWGKPEAFKPHA